MGQIYCEVEVHRYMQWQDVINAWPEEVCFKTCHVVEMSRVALSDKTCTSFIYIFIRCSMHVIRDLADTLTDEEKEQ
jgi:hypothetical protein